MTYSTQEFLRAAQQRLGLLKRELGKADGYLHQHHERRAQLATAHSAACNDLARMLVSEWTQEAIDIAANVTGFQQILTDRPREAAERERNELALRLRAIENDPRYANRELLCHPRTGSLTRKLAELETYIAPFRETLARTSHPRFPALVTSGYGTSEYSTGFWRVSYYEDWKAGDEILEKFPEKQFFSEVREEVRRAQDSIGPLAAEAERLRAEIKMSEALEAEHKGRFEALQTVVPRHLSALQRRVTDFVLQVPPAAMGPRFAHFPALDLLYKRAAGLTHQTQYLDAIIKNDVGETRTSLVREIQGLEKDIQKFSRPKKASMRFPRDKFDKRFGDRTGSRYQKRWSRFERSYESVYQFRDYQRASFLQDFLWWDLMTDGRVDGDFVPEVASFRRAHPNYTYDASQYDSGDARGALGDLHARRERSEDQTSDETFVDAS